MKIHGSMLIVFMIALALIPGACATTIEMGGGTSASLSGGSSIQSNFVADNNGAAFEASTTGVIDEFKRAQLLDFGGKYIIDSEAAIEDGSIGIYSEITKPTKFGSETSVNLVAAGSSVDVALSGQEGSSATGHGARVGNGIISSSLNLAIGDSISAYQNTALMGDEGALGSVAKSRTNTIVIDGGFSGTGDLNAILTTVAGDSAMIHGTTSFNGMEVVNNNVLQTVNDGELSVSADGIYEDRKGDLGNFGVAATNIVTPSPNNVAYKTGGWAWESPIHYKLSTNLIGTPTSTNANLWAQEISKGANEWDRNTAKDVFKGLDTTNTPGSNNVLEFTSYLPTVGRYQGGTGDGKNNYMAVTRAVTGSTIAVAWTWYDTAKYVTGADGKQYYKAMESDVYYNANKAWRVATAESTLTNSRFDARTIATHEVGHSLGLLDLYTYADKNKIMYGYNNGEVKWYLRNEDKLGLWSLYGR